MKNLIHILFFTFILGSIDYNSEIQPIFDNSCGNCHLGSSSGGLNLSNYANLMSSGTVIAGDHQNSILYDRITRSESEPGDMPPAGSLSQQEIDLIAQWIDEGALENPLPDCEEGFTYIENIPTLSCIVLDGSNCFANQDIAALGEIASLNGLESDYGALGLGTQNWSNGRLTRLLVGNNSNGGFVTLTQLPESIGDLNGLVQLYLNENQITVLPDSIGNLSNILYLILSFNNIESLPESIGNLNNLIWLDLGYNSISYIPESIGQLNNLSYLWIFGNQLSSIPNSICDLDIDWDGYDVNFAPYFGSGGNFLCDAQNIPDCVENSANFEIALDQAYYSFTVSLEQDCESLLGDVNLDGGVDVLDIVLIVNYVTGSLELSEEAINTGDINQDSTLNVLDIVTIVNLILGN